MQDEFKNFHPIITFCYFALMIIFTMMFIQPILLIISLLSAVFYAVYLNAKKARSFILKFCVPVVLIWTIINVLTNTKGVDVFLYINDRPLTKQSLIYGLMSGMAFATIMIWFFCYNRVITTDKFLYLFGRALPSTSLLISMALRFVPRFNDRAKRIENARKTIGKSIDEGSIKQRASSGGTILMTLTNWSLENSMTTADSMNSRGYGTAKRTRFSTYKITRTEKVLIPFILILIIGVIAGVAVGLSSTSYYPEIIYQKFSIKILILYICYGLLCMFPVICNLFEVIRWQFLKQKI